MYNMFLIFCAAYVLYSLCTNTNMRKDILHSATLYIVLANIIVFIITFGGNLFTNILGNNFYYTIGHLQLYRTITSMFCHANFSHILCNMVSLLSIGLAVETMYGKKKMLIGYFSTGIIGGLISLFIHNIMLDNVLSVGASGAICGLIGVLVVSIFKTQRNAISNIMFMIMPLLLIGVSAGNVDNIAHFSCFFVGILVGPQLKNFR